MLGPERISDKEIIQAILSRDPVNNDSPSWREKMDYHYAINHLKDDYRGMTVKMIKDHFNQLPVLASLYLDLPEFDELVNHVQNESILRFITLVHRRKESLDGYISGFFKNVTKNILRETLRDAKRKKKEFDKDRNYRKENEIELINSIQDQNTNLPKKISFEAKESFFKPYMIELLNDLNVDDETREVIFLRSEERMSFLEIAQELNPHLNDKKELKKIEGKLRFRFFSIRQKWKSLWNTQYFPVAYKLKYDEI